MIPWMVEFVKFALTQITFCDNSVIAVRRVWGFMMRYSVFIMQALPLATRVAAESPEQAIKFVALQLGADLDVYMDSEYPAELKAVEEPEEPEEDYGRP